MSGSRVPWDVKIEGIAGGYDPLYLPIGQESDVRPGYVETTAAKVGTDPNVDIYNNIAAYPILLDLSGGAWSEFFDIQERRYFEPYHARPTSLATTTIVQPLLWTLDRNNPLMVGCEHVADANLMAFDQYIRYRGKLYGLDKTNNKIYKNTNANTGAWTDVTPATSGTLTQMFVDAKGGTFILGTSSAKAWKATDSNLTSSDWSAHTPTGSFYATYGNDVYYITQAGSSAHNNAYALMRRVATVAKKMNPQYVGNAYSDATNMVWADRWMVVLKPEGAFACLPARKQGSQMALQPFPNADDGNGQVCFLHGRDVYFSTVDDFYSWNVDSGAVIPRNLARHTGYAKKPFLNGRVLAGMSDGRQIYLIYKITGDDGSGNTITDYYVVIGDGENWHPVHAVSYWGDGGNHAAVWFDTDKLRYSMAGKSGYLRTDGRIPIVTTGNSFTYSTDAAPCGITTGWFDAGRDWLIKWFKEVRISQRDRGTKGVVKVWYQTWGTAPGTWTAIGTLQGNQDNTALALPAGTLAGISGITASKINLRFDLRKADGTENTTAHYVASAHVVGMPFYEPAFQCTLVIQLDTEGLENSENSRSFTASTVYAGLLAAQAQEEPVKLTIAGMGSWYGSIRPAAGGTVLLDIDPETQKPRRYIHTIVFTEHR